MTASEMRLLRQSAVSGSAIFKGGKTMISLYESGVYLINGNEVVTDPAEVAAKTGKTLTKEAAAQNTMAYAF